MCGATPRSAPEPVDAAPDTRAYRLPTLIVAAALFMETMEATAVATALPQMAHDYGESPVTLKLALTVYMVGLAMFIPASTWLADRIGTRRVFRLALSLFALGSAGCAVSPTLMWLVLARFVQSVGGAMMVPVGRMVLLKLVPQHHLVHMLSRLALPAMLGPVLGPVVGGLITTHSHWRLLFVINLPVALVIWALAGRCIPQFVEADTRRLDARGFLLCSGSLGALSLGLASLGQRQLDLLTALVLTVVGVIGLVVYARHARHATQPLLDLSLLKLPTLAAGVLGGSMFRIGIGATPFLLSLKFQIELGMDAARAGLLLTASAVGAMLVKTVSAHVLRRFGFRPVLLGNGFLAALSMMCFGFIELSTPMIWMVAVLLAGGLSRSLQFSALHSISYADVPRPRLGPATALASSVQQLSLSLGVTLGAQALTLSAQTHAHALPDSADFRFAFLVVGCCAMVSLWWPWRLAASAGEALARQEAARG